MEPGTRQNEAALARAARTGDREALKLLLTANWNWLRCLVYGITCDAAEIDDILQQICVRVIGKIDSLRRPNCFRPWLAALARNETLRYLRKRKVAFSLDDPHTRHRCPEEPSRPC